MNVFVALRNWVQLHLIIVAILANKKSIRSN